MSTANVEVSNPSHYAQPNFIEPIDRIGNVGFNTGSSYKYLQRLGLKGGDNTEARDAKAAAWYMIDLVHRLLAEEEGDFSPTTEDIAEFDLVAFINQVGAYGATTESNLGLKYTDQPNKAFVLAAQDMIIDAFCQAVKVGMSEQHYKEFVLEVMFVSYYTVSFCLDFTDHTKITDFVTIYKGSTSLPLTDDLKAAFAHDIAQITARAPVLALIDHNYGRPLADVAA